MARARQNQLNDGLRALRTANLSEEDGTIVRSPEIFLQRKPAVDGVADPSRAKVDIFARRGCRMHKPALYASWRLGRL
jgi:hypothetical protein